MLLFSTLPLKKKKCMRLFCNTFSPFFPRKTTLKIHHLIKPIVWLSLDSAVYTGLELPVHVRRYSNTYVIIFFLVDKYSPLDQILGTSKPSSQLGFNPGLQCLYVLGLDCPECKNAVKSVQKDSPPSISDHLNMIKFLIPRIPQVVSGHPGLPSARIPVKLV